MLKVRKPSSILPWCIWGLAAFFFFFHYVVRVTPGQIVGELQSAFADTTNTDIGFLGAAFYLPYAIMQMPVGYLVDRFGSRLLLTIAVTVCGISCIIFAHATVFGTAILSRVMLGFCSAAAFIGALKLITVWFEPKKLALLVGVTQALGMVGSATGNSPLIEGLNDAIGWQNTFNFYGVIFFLLGVFICIIVRNRPNNVTLPLSSKPSNTSTSFSSHLSLVLFNKYTWINALYAGLIFAPTDALGELWGNKFLTNIHHLEHRDASYGISLLLIGWAIGGPLAGTLADHIGRKPVMMLSGIFGLILFPIIFYIPDLPLSWIMICMFLFGFTNTGLVASYAAAGELHSNENAGFSMAIANMFSILIGAALMPVLGKLVEWQAASHMAGSHIYASGDYERATYILPICLLLAVICSFFVKETLPNIQRDNLTTHDRKKIS